MRRRRLSAVPIIAVVVLLLVGLIGTTLTAPAARPSPDITLPGVPNGTPRPTQTPLGRYPRTAEATIVGSCVSGIDPNTVPAPIAQAFCVCVLNGYEQLYPAYDEFQQATNAGTITEDLKTQISNRCVQAIVGG
ncbi:MAG TPA: hypothetical protein VGA38_08980 [Candidatus Limnocylindria bacterium]